MIATERLRLCPMTMDDADFLFDLFSRPEVARWSGTGEPMASRQQAVERIERQPERIGDHPACGIFTVFRAEMPIGRALLVPLPPSAGRHGTDIEIEIGWHFHPGFWGHGYASEAGQAMVERGFEAGFTELYAVTAPDNVRSQRVCARLGMTDLGLRDDWYDETLRAFVLHAPTRPPGTDQ